jgi:hypothetical protein
MTWARETRMEGSLLLLARNLEEIVSQMTLMHADIARAGVRTSSARSQVSPLVDCVPVPSLPLHFFGFLFPFRLRAFKQMSLLFSAVESFPIRYLIAVNGPLEVMAGAVEEPDSTGRTFSLGLGAAFATHPQKSGRESEREREIGRCIVNKKNSWRMRGWARARGGRMRLVRTLPHPRVFL